MNEELIQESYDYFKEGGFTGSLDQYKNLLVTNPKALDVTHQYFTSQKQYQGTVDDLALDLGVKKKDDTESIVEETESVSVSPQQTIQPTSSVTQEKETALERVFGKNAFTDFFSDLYRSGVQGVAQGATVDDALKIFRSGKEVSQEDLNEYIEAVQNMQSYGPSDEMREFQEIYEKEGGGLLGFVKGLGNNLSLIPQLFTSSLVSMANKGSLKMGIKTGAGGGALGLGVGGIGAIPGAIAGAIGGLGGSLETALSFTEFLQEELDEKGLEFNNDGIRKVLEDADAMERIRYRSAGRGIAIGAIEALSGGLASKLATKVARKTGSKLKGAAAGIGTEAVGGGTGEVAGRTVAGQEMDVADIGFETVVGTATAPLTVGYGIYKANQAPFYRLNGEIKTREEVQEFLENAPAESIEGAELTIKNDNQLSGLQEEKIKEITIQKQVENEASPNMSEEDKQTIIELEKEKEKIGPNPLRLGEQRIIEINEQIDLINKKYPILQEEKEITETEKTKTDAIQEQSPDDVDATEQTVDVSEVEEGTPESETEIIAETVTEEVEKEPTEPTKEPSEPTGLGTPETDANVPNQLVNEGGLISNSINKVNTILDYFKEKKKNVTSRETFDNIKEKYYDKYTRIRDIQKGIEKKKGTFVKDEQNFSDAEKVLYGKTRNLLDTLDVKLNDILNRANKNNLNTNQISNYLYAKHAEERNKFIKENRDATNEAGSGMTNEQAQETLNTFTPQETKQLEKVSKEIYALLNQDLKEAYDNGLISKTAYENLKNNPYNNYVPLTNYNLENVDADFQGGGGLGEGGKRLSPIGKTYQPAKGRTSLAGDVLANIFQRRTATIIRAQKNLTLQKLLNLVEKNPDPDQYEVFSEDTPGITKSLDKEGRVIYRDKSGFEMSKDYVRVLRDGKDYFINFKAPKLNEIFNNSNPTKANIFTNVLQAVNSVLRPVLTTLNPEFIITNYIRDLQTGVMNALGESGIEIKNSAKFVKDVATLSATKALPVITQYELGKYTTPKGNLKSDAVLRDERNSKDKIEIIKYYDEFVKQGGKTGYFYMKDIKDIQKDINAYNKKGVFGPLSDAKKWFTKWVDTLNAAAENSTRLAAYVIARKQGISKQKAAAIGKDLTINFNQSGTSSDLNNWFLFFNASVQGTARLAKALGTKRKVKDPKTGKIIKEYNPAQKAMFGIITLGALSAWANRAASDEDEDGISYYDKIPDYEKERNIIIMKDNGKDYLKVPLPYGYNIFYNIGNSIQDLGSQNKSLAETLGFISRSFMGSFSPINFSDSPDVTNQLIKTVLPTALKPIGNLALNENYFGSTIYNENFPLGTPTPDAERGRRSTPELFKVVSKWLNTKTGGTKYRSGEIDVAPESLEYLVESYVGQPYKFGERTVRLIDKLATGQKEDIEYREMPIVRRFAGSVSRYQDITDYYDRKTYLSQLSKELEGIKRGELDAQEELRAYGAAEALLKLSKRIDKKLKEIRETKKKVEVVKDESKKSSYLRKLEEREDKLYDAFNKAYLKFFERHNNQFKKLTK